MVENLYVAERLGREKIEELLRQADERRLERSVAEAALAGTSGDFGLSLAGRSPSAPAPRRA